MGLLHTVYHLEHNIAVLAHRTTFAPATHTMDALVAAAAAAGPIAYPAMWTAKEAVDLARAPKSAILFFAERYLIQSVARPCPTCTDVVRPLTLYADTRYTDGYRVRCTHCHGDWSVRHGSIAEHFQLTLTDLATLIAYFDAHVQIHQAIQLAGCHRNTVCKLYAAVRVRCRDFLDRHPILFDQDEIVEIDELFIGALRTPPNEEGEGEE
jgi:transposase-like protein